MVRRIPPKPVSPCKRDCPDRNGECHAKCEVYQRYEAELLAWRPLAEKVAIAKLAYADMKDKAISKTQKKVHSRK